MKWSLSSVSYRMSGSGSWQNLLADEEEKALYAGIYPGGVAMQDFPGPAPLLSSWRDSAIVRLSDGRVAPLGPIMTDADLQVLAGWFQEVCGAMCAAVTERLPNFRAQAAALAPARASSGRYVDNIMTILTCAVTLDSWVFARLRRAVMGTYPPRGRAGDFFFWGYAFAAGPERIFGFTTYNGLARGQLHVMRSHELDREALKTVLAQRFTWDYLRRLTAGGEVSGQGRVVQALRDIGLLDREGPPRLAVPVFSDDAMEAVNDVCEAASGQVLMHFLGGLKGLEALVGRCSFARCNPPDVLCMLFHLAYSYAADRLVAERVIPDFPKSAGAEWGVWVR